MTQDPVEVISNFISDALKTDVNFTSMGTATHIIEVGQQLPFFYVILQSFGDDAHRLTPNIKRVSYNLLIGAIDRDARSSHKFEEKIRSIIGDNTRDPTSSFFSTSNIYQMEISGGNQNQLERAGSAIHNRELQLEVMKQYVHY